MSEFKIGDRIRVIRSRNYFGEDGFGHEVGSIHVIKGKDDSLSKGSFDAWDVEAGGWVRSDDIELVEEAPMPTPEYSCIRVVPPSKPKREIVESTITLDGFAEIEVMTEGCDDTDVKLLIQGCPFFNAKALREAAALFTTLAEVLEENSNA